jgi:N-acetylmuramoyl-L-alanine amidase
MSAIKIDGIDYFSLTELRHIMRTSNHFIDYENNKVTFNIFNESIILFKNTFFVSSRGRLSNLSYPIIKRHGDFFVPITFFTRSLPDFFPDKFVWDKDRSILITDRPTDRRIRTIVLDPGHGGTDPGAIGRRVREKDVVLEIALGLKERLERDLDVRVLLTRSTDVNVHLRARTEFANLNQADLFLSLHANGSENRTAHGVEVFFLSAARTDDERAVEMKENQVVYDFEGGAAAVQAYNDLAFILADLLQTQHLEESSDLAVRLQTEIVNRTGAHDRGVKQGDLFVLRGAFMPAVLIEFGFITNQAEETRLMSREHQNRLISAVVDGIRSFKFKYDNIW